jgi:hypothetical protein
MVAFYRDVPGFIVTDQGRLGEAAPRALAPITHGNARSIYFRDSEDIRVEICTDTPWHVTQPVRETIDLDRTEAEIVEETEAFCRGRPRFQPMAAWRREVAARLADATQV